jgi:hypothetical protein
MKCDNSEWTPAGKKKHRSTTAGIFSIKACRVARLAFF